MTTIKFKNKKAVTLMELMITIGIAAVVTFAVAIMLADNLRAWSTMYSRMHSDEAENVYAVRRLFDRVVRSTSRESLISVSDTALGIFYFDDDDSDPSTLPVKCQATFIYNGTTLDVQCIKLSDGTVIESWTIPNVIQCRFKQSGEPSRAIQMLLTINNTVNNRTQTVDVYSCAYKNNL